MFLSPGNVLETVARCSIQSTGNYVYDFVPREVSNVVPGSSFKQAAFKWHSLKNFRLTLSIKKQPFVAFRTRAGARICNAFMLCHKLPKFPRQAEQVGMKPNKGFADAYIGN